MMVVTLSGDLQKATNVLKEIQARNKQAVDFALRELAKRMMTNLKTSIRGGKLTGKNLASATLLKRKFGKQAGGPGSSTPFGVPTYQGAMPLHQSGALANAIWWRNEGPTRKKVEIRSGALGPQGQSLQDIAIAQEFGFTASIPMSKRMLSYLLLLYGRITPKRSSGKRNDDPDKLTGRVIHVVVPPRPVWATTWNLSLTFMPMWFTKSWVKHLRLSDGVWS